MKVIEIGQGRPTLDEVIDWAENEVVVLRKSDGTTFALTQVDDFDVEIEALRANPGFMTFLRQLSQGKPPFRCKTNPEK